MTSLTRIGYFVPYLVQLTPEERWLSAREVADWLGLSTATLKNWRQRKIGPDYTKRGQPTTVREGSRGPRTMIVYDRDLVLQWLKSQTAEAA